ncbi:hypothetical protein K227x_38930 [Rubripirellula lacrimiformis]|uniref:Lipoprotein n=1 Tax=Rubripirellula lacrimiformis TaxID=1930273 RepID=A0A517NED9_9BACT|nr:hypothetical protein [Rubripirellula lacrimiformis]QDT05493.1 hypothetical protein K227x_38930 [Rubripirellula lacrimiformis]
MTGVRSFVFAAVAAVCFTQAGCSSSDSSSVTAAGTVTVAGQPLSGAVITLEPMSGTTGPNASVPVLGGQFEIGPEAELHGGQYRVRVSMIPASIRSGIPTKSDDGTTYQLPAADAMIDPAFDGDSKLTCDLRSGEVNPLQFDVRFLK